MNRAFALIATLAVLVFAALAAGPERSQAAVLVGVGDQDPATFSDDLFSQLGLKRSRYFPSWNVAFREKEALLLNDWLVAADEAGVEPLISFSQAAGSACPSKPCKLPSVREYTRAFRAFRARWPEVKIISPWNEANHRSQPTFKNPKRAAQFYNAVRANCRGCRIVAADVIDEKNMERWLKVFKKHAKKPKLWGLHNYRDTNPRRNQTFGGTERLLKAVKGPVWLTETGGIVKFKLPGGGLLFPRSESRANRATRRMFSLARRYRSRIQRLYIYHWKQPAAKDARFDAGLVRADGTPRPAYRTVQAQLRTSIFNP